MSSNKTPAVKTSGVGKEFNGVSVLRDVDFDLREGEIHSVVGENGAGKSTFIKILSGVYKPSFGSLEIEGKPMEFESVAQSEEAGVRTVMQEINLVEYFAIYQNIFMGSELTTGFFKTMDDKRMREEAVKVMKRLGVDADVSETVAGLNVAMKKAVEICKVLVHSPKIVIFDEPTTALGEEERDHLLEIIEALKSKGLSIIYISHNLEEVMQISDRISVFRDGNKVATVEKDSTSIDDLIKLMLGDKTYFNYKRMNNYSTDETLIDLENVSTHKLRGVSFSVKKGEVVGIAGVVGAGKTELAKAIFGIDKLSGGSITYRGEKFVPSPGSAVKNGMAFVPEERQAEGLIPDFPITSNITIAYLDKWSRLGVLNNRQEADTAREYIDRLSIKAQGPEQLIKYLSGGNQQKTILSRWLSGEFDLGIYDEPTKGIDIKAKEDIYTLIDVLAKQGKSIIMLSSYLPELMVTCDRILVLRNGALVCEFANSDTDEGEILAAMLGGKKQDG